MKAARQVGINSVIIATNASFLADTLREKLRDASFKVYIATNDEELTEKIKAVFPRYIFVENCFHGFGTDVFIQKIVKRNRNVHIAVWAASEVKPVTAARFIVAGAESFFSLRDTYQNIENILYRIAGGRCYYPVDVEAALDKDSAYPVIEGELTTREIEITKMLISGKTNRQIGVNLSLNENTVKFHKRNICRKLGGDKTIDIMRNGIIRGIIQMEDIY